MMCVVVVLAHVFDVQCLQCYSLFVCLDMIHFPARGYKGVHAAESEVTKVPKSLQSTPQSCDCGWVCLLLVL